MLRRKGTKRYWRETVGSQVIPLRMALQGAATGLCHGVVLGEKTNENGVNERWHDARWVEHKTTEQTVDVWGLGPKRGDEGGTSSGSESEKNIDSCAFGVSEGD